MPTKEQVQQMNTSLLTITANDLIGQLSEKKDLVQVRQAAFDHWDAESDKVFQVQIIVTRNNRDFLDAFQTEEMKNYQSK